MSCSCHLDPISCYILLESALLNWSREELTVAGATADCLVGGMMELEKY